MSIARPPRKGRGAQTNREGRFESLARAAVDDGWGTLEEDPPSLRTTVAADASRSVIARNDSPDVPFDRSINPYRGCEHGCVYCYARPTHAWLGLSPGLDFESRLFFKADAPTRLREELSRRAYRPAPIALGANTDPYQPLERRLGVTRAILEVLAECRHPVRIVTKSALVERDLDLLCEMARARLVTVTLSVTTLDPALARRMEPRASAPARRVRAVETLAEAGVPTGTLFAPVIPFVNDAEMETVLATVREAGARDVGWVLLRLPLEIADLFREWLERHYPDRAARVMERIRDSRGGREYESEFGRRMRGSGPFAELIERRFDLARRRLGFPGFPELDAEAFRPPAPAGQLSLL